VAVGSLLDETLLMQYRFQAATNQPVMQDTEEFELQTHRYNLYRDPPDFPLETSDLQVLNIPVVDHQPKCQPYHQESPGKIPCNIFLFLVINRLSLLMQAQKSPFAERGFFFVDLHCQTNDKGNRLRDKQH
jgi:hypothetical protein